MTEDEKSKWFTVLKNIIAYSVSAVFGALGMSAISGCACMPNFFF